MMLSVSEFRADMLTLLGDETGRRYSESILDMGLREALAMYGRYVPRLGVVKARVGRNEGNCAVINWVPGEGEEITGARGPASQEFSWVSWQFVDGSCWLRFPYRYAAPSEGEMVELMVKRPHYLKGLDGAKVTTVPEGHRPIVCTGAAGYAMQMRARSVTEVFGKRPEDREALNSQAEVLTKEFLTELNRAALIESFRHDPW